VTDALALERADTGLLLVDIQERLAAAMPAELLAGALRRWVALVEMAGPLGLPVALSEHYPRGLGPTLPPIKETLARLPAPARQLEKLEFSLCDAPDFPQLLDAGRRTWIVAGMECHVCVYQTVRGLVARGHRVHVPVDAVLSRRKADWQVGCALMARLGAVMTSTETALFDLVRRADGPAFSTLRRLTSRGAAASRIAATAATGSG
jgi:nicotinamidase-related amidase